MTRNAGRVIAKSDAEENLRFSPARWLIAGAIFHLAVTCIVYGLGRFAVLPAAFDRNGIAVSFAPDGVQYLRDTIALSETLARGVWLDWFNASSPFHLKLYSISFALTGWLTGRNIMSAEPLNLLCYLAMLVLVFQLGREVFDARAGLLAAVAVALLPSHLLHTTQLLKDPLFEVGMLTLVLLMARAQSGIQTWTEALLKGIAGGTVAVLTWYTRPDFWEIIVATAFIGVALLAARQLCERRGRATNLTGVGMLLSLAIVVPLLLTNVNATDSNRETLNNKIRRQAFLSEIAAAPPPSSHIWSRLAARVGVTRRRFVHYYPASGSNIDSGVRINGLGDLVRYLPRAAVIGFFAPFPAMWFVSGNQVGSAGRLLVGSESLVIYAIECLAVLGLWRGRRRFQTWLLCLVAAMSILTLGLVVVNAGALYRMRYVFLMLVMIIAAGGAARVIDRLSSKPSGNDEPSHGT